MAAKKTKKSSRPKTLRSRVVQSEDAKNVRGGAYQAYLTIEGKKQGKFK